MYRRVVASNTPAVLTRLTSTDLDAVAHFEVKRTERLDLRSSMAQAIHDTGSAIGCHPMPIVVQRGSHQEWLAIMRAEDCITMLKKIAQPPSEG